MSNLVCSWSGGKDSCFALMRVINQGYKPKALLNVLNEAGQISRSHGLPASILKAQSKSMNIPVHMVASSWQDYEQRFTATLQALKEEYGLTHAVFGDIDLQAHRDWEEKVCDKTGLTALLPLWQEDRKQLVERMLDEGIEAYIVSCNETMGEKFLGRQITYRLLRELESIGIDPCGENGEYHTLVTNCPLFESPVRFNISGSQLHDRYWFVKWNEEDA